MSLFTQVFSAPTDELLKINIKPTPTYTKYVSGQTISVSFLNTGNDAIFEAYKNQFNTPGAIDTGNLTFAGNVWAQNQQWGENANTAIQAASEIIKLNFNQTDHVASSDLRWTPVNDVVVGNSYILGLSFYTPSSNIDGIGGKDAGILIYANNPFHNDSANANAGDGNERTSTMVHELGHFLGLAHPFSDTPAPFAELDDVRYDVMSYDNAEDGRRKVTTDLGNGGKQLDPVYNFGGFVNFAPINIAQLQYMYGENKNTHKSNTTYTLSDTNTAALDLNGEDGNVTIGRAYYTIWDNGGIDQIVYNGNSRVLININEASLKRTNNDTDLVNTLKDVKNSDAYNGLESDYANKITDAKYYAGGFFSNILTNDDDIAYLNLQNKYINLLGGYAIAKGVEIENAQGGSNNDIIIGNQYDNDLKGNDGNDTIFGGAGDDIMHGGNGNDIFYLDKGSDIINGDAGSSDKVIIASNFAQNTITIVGNQVTITDNSSNAHGTNIINDVEFFEFKDKSFSLENLNPSSAAPAKPVMAVAQSEFVSKLGLLNNAANDTFWGDNGDNSFFANEQKDLYDGGKGADIVTFTGNKTDYNISVDSQTNLKIISKTDANNYDLLHSVEKIIFNGVEFDATTLNATDLGLTASQFTDWQTNYDFG